MKKLFLIITTLFAAFLSSCTQEEMANGSAATSKRVSLSAELPGTIANTRAEISVPATHQLRCVLEVWTRGTATSSLAYRAEQAVESGGIPTFNFELEPGDYSYLMWADFIERDAATEEVTADDVTYTHYADLFYDTSDLRNITMKEAAALFDTDLCDAFFVNGDFDKSDETIQRTLRMARPFAKLIAVEKNAEDYAKLTGLTVSYDVPAGFNVSTGEPLSEKVTAGYAKDNMQSADNVLFTHYIFASSMGGYALPVASITLKSTMGNASCEMPAGSVTLERNHQVRAVGAFLAGGTVVPEPEPEPARDPQVGDYFFIDGTWSSELNGNNLNDCVGIVYSVGPNEQDDIANYGPEAEGKSILGYVMALQNTGIPKKADGTDLFPDPKTRYILSNSRPYFYMQTAEGGAKDDAVTVLTKQEGYWDAFDGVTATANLLAHPTYAGAADKTYYPALLVFETWKATTATKPANASAWYIPSSGQLYEAAMKCYADTYTLKDADKNTYRAWEIEKDEALLNALNAAIDAGIATTFCGNNNTNGYYLWTSTMNTDAMPMAIQIGAAKVTNLYSKPNYRTQGLIRPFLTIIK